MKHLLALLILLWALPAHATVTLLDNARAAKDGHIPVTVSIDGGPAYRLQHTVPSATVDIQTWLTNNVGAEDEAAWKAEALKSSHVPAVAPEEWVRITLTANDIPPFMRAFIRVYAAREGVSVATIVAEIKVELNK